MVRTFLCQPLADPKVFSDEYEPTCCCSTASGLILIASGSSNAVHVYSASGRSSCRTVLLFETVGMAKKLTYCSFGNYVASLESKWQEPRGSLNPRVILQYARVYVNWMKERDSGTYITQKKIGYTQDPLSLHNHAGKFLAIDIPVKYSVNDISCCNTNGNIALSTEAKVYLYTYRETKIGMETDNVIIDFDCALEIDSGFQINHIALFGNYVAFASPYEIRAIQVMMDRKESIMQAEDVSKMLDEDELQANAMIRQSVVHCSMCQSVTDENFVSWNIELGRSQGLDSLEHETITVQRRKTASVSFGTPTYVVDSSCIKFEAVAQDATYINLENNAKEILGPKEVIKGHPLIVINNYNDLGFVNVNHVTMLYRRFLNEQTDLSCDGPSIHSVQWLPIYADDSVQNRMSSSSISPVSTEFSPTIESSSKILVSLCLFFSTGRKGYLYDVLNTPRLLTEYDFTEACISACLTRKLLHVITKNGLETYTTRLYPSASLAAKAYQGEDNLQYTDHHANERQRTYSSLSFSSGSDYESRGHSCERMADFSEEEQLPDDISPQEGHFTKVPPTERKTNSKKGKTKLSLKLRKKKMIDKADRKSPSSDDDSVKRERSGSFIACSERQNDVVYSMDDLIQPCPPTSIEICLIGIYPVRGFVFVGSTERHIVLLQKTFEFKGKRGSIGKERVMPWNVYVREVAPAIDVYRDIINLIEGSEFANPKVFHQLLSEAHLILRADLASNTPEDRRENIRASIRRSAVKLGDFFSRCKNDFDYFMAKEYYDMAGIKLEQLLLRHDKRDKEENLATKYGIGIIDFLNEKLLEDVDEPIQLPEDSVLHILKIYSAAAPHLLSQLILNSRLKCIPADKAASLLDQFEHTEANSPEYRLSSLDYVTMAVLHLLLCDPNHAEHNLRRLTDEQLIEVISRHPDLVINEGNITHLGQLLRRHFTLAFTSILVILLDNGTVNIKTAVSSYGVQTEDISGTSTKPNYKLWELLETLLNDEKRREDYPEIVGYLLQQYISWFQSKGAVALLNIPHQHIPKGNGHFAPRFDWLDKLPPFSGESPVPQDCLLRKQLLSSRNATPEGSPNSAKKSTHQFDFNQSCSCCCCNSVLLKIQSLLCSPFCSELTCQTLVDFAENTDCFYSDSIKLLCYPAIGKFSDAVQFVVTKHPSIMLHYAKDVFRNSKTQWQIFLEFLLKTLKDDLYERWNKETYLDALKGTLTKLARICNPTEFLKLLPKDGTARFFLPFIQDCHQMHSAVSMRSNMLHNTEATTA